MSDKTLAIADYGNPNIVKAFDAKGDAESGEIRIDKDGALRFVATGPKEKK